MPAHTETATSHALTPTPRPFPSQGWVFRRGPALSFPLAPSLSQIWEKMKRGGARWVPERVNPMLAALGELHSGRWDEMWGRIRPKAA